MKVCVIGSGYVGLVTGTGLADTGHSVICADIDVDKISRLGAGEVPIFEPGLEPLLERNLAQGRIRFTTDVTAAVRESELIMIAVGTPAGEDGSADLTHVLDVAGTIGSSMDGPKVVVTKSTVPVGTSALVRREIEALTSHPVHVAANPEFLKEGDAVNDFMKPSRVIVGTDSEVARRALEELYEPFVRTGNPIIFMDPLSAEVTKYAANAMLATRISFMNSIARLCEAVGADVGQVRKGVGSDPRIGSSFLFPGLGYGGSCFPKDVKALVRTLHAQGVDAGILEAVESVNERQKAWPMEILTDRWGQSFSGRTVAVWGLAFKPETDDVREAPALLVIDGLLDAGASVRVHDFAALETARKQLGERVTYCASNYDAVDGADALVIATEWQPYRRPDLERVRRLMNTPLVIDGRNLFDPQRMRAAGFEYSSVGRPPALPLRLGELEAEAS